MIFIQELKTIIYNSIIINSSGNIGWKIRQIYYKKKLKQCGISVLIDKGTELLCPKNISIGNFVRITKDCLIHGDGGIDIGDYTMIASGVKIFTSNHIFKDISIPIMHQGESYKSVKIGSDCWIGANCLILSGVSVGDHSIIGAGSVVTKDIPSYSVVVGNPAHIIKNRLSEKS